MPILDFSEISPAHEGDDLDAFELFARDFLEFVGYRILTPPNRGADGGRDLIVEELRAGVGGETRIKWLVSCKHKAHSGRSVTPDDESEIRDRIDQHGCDGFIAVYSTLPSTGLANRLDAFKQNPGLAVLVYDRERIETILLESTQGLSLALRYFPNSAARWKNDNPTPATLYGDAPSLDCHACKKNLLDPIGGIVVAHSIPNDDNILASEIVNVYWCCKGECDDQLKAEKLQPGWLDSWEDIEEIATPLVYLKWSIATMNRLKAGILRDQVAFERYRELLINLYPFVARQLTTNEDAKYDPATTRPHWMGGLDATIAQRGI